MFHELNNNPFLLDASGSGEYISQRDNRELHWEWSFWASLSLFYPKCFSGDVLSYTPCPSIPCDGEIFPSGCLEWIISFLCLVVY